MRDIEADKHLIIMDEVDGMAGNEDRGGIAEMILKIKSSKVPIICICNDRQHVKIRSLANHCFDLRFNKPGVNQVIIECPIFEVQLQQQLIVSFLD